MVVPLSSLELYATSHSVYWFFLTIESQLVLIFQDVWHWSLLSAAVHSIPIGMFYCRWQYPITVI